MAELTHDTAEEGFHEIQLSGKQLVFLGMATIAVSVLIFLLGVLVGRGVRAEQAEASTIDAIPVASSAPVDPAPVAAEPSAPAVQEPLSYPQRLNENPPPESLNSKSAEPEPAPPADAEPPAAAQASEASRPAVDVPTTGRPGRWVVQVTALSKRDTAAEVVQRLIGKGYPAFLLMPSPGAPVLYRIQIGRYNDRGEAERVARQLAKQEQFTPEVKR